MQRSPKVVTPLQWALLGLLGLGTHLNALDPTQKITQYAHTTWSRENGQFAASVLALAQTPDGSLWIGADSGLQRFDGVRFQPWRPPPGQQLSSEQIMALAPDRDGGLWIGTRAGLSHWKDGEVLNYPTSKGPAGPSVTAVLVDHAGTVWAGSAGYRSGALCRMENGNLLCDSKAEGLPGFMVLSLFEDRTGSLWSGGRGVCRWKSKDAAEFCVLQDRGEAVYSIAQNRQGEILAGGMGLKKLARSNGAASIVPGIDPKLPIKTLLTDCGGGLWIGTLGQGLIHYYQGRIDRFTQMDGLSNDNVESLLEDREGNIWVGTEGGLDRFREYSVTRISTREGISSNSVHSVFASREGGIWAGTANGLNRIAGDRVRVYGKREGLASGEVGSIFEEADGRLWVLTAGGLAYFDGGRFHPLRLPKGRKIWCRAAAETRDHSVWLSDPQQGLIRLHKAQVADIVPWSQFANKQAWSLEPDTAGDGLWLGFGGGEVAYYRLGHPVRWYVTQSASRGGPVTGFHAERDGSLWIATETGLGRLRNSQVAILSVANGLPCNGIRDMVEDDDGKLWLNTDCGLVAISDAELRRWAADADAKLQVKVFDAADGMRRGRRATGSFGHATKSTDGRLWFAVFDGIAVVDPRHLPENHLPPPVKIEQIVAGPGAHPIDSRLALPPLTKEVRISYTAMSFVIPEKVHFRYHLEGFDADWKDNAGQRQAIYTNLPPRCYKFQVIASNNDGVWNNLGASLDFSIRPAIYQTRLFQLLCVCALAALLWRGHRFRLGLMSRQLRIQFQTRLDERTRIAREMHDSLLQDLCGFALQLDGLAKLGAVPTSAREVLLEVRQELDKCAREARELVWDLRAPILQELDLCEALREAGEQITQGQPVNFHVTVLGTRRRAPAKLQQQLFRIVQEATRNAVRYSQATEIDMEIAYLDSDRIRVEMRDDGCGFDPEEAARQAGHWGLRTMRERAEQIGAELTIFSAPGHGTRIEIVAPMTSLA